MLFKLALFSSLFMTGLIWFVQWVHYPLFAKVGAADFLEYEKNHTKWISFLVAPMMVFELAIAFFLLYNQCWDPFHFLAFIFLLFVWISTFGIQVPLHNKLMKIYDKKTIKLLIKTNWIRTIFWTGRSALLLYLL